MNLDFSPENFHKYLDLTCDLVRQRYAHLDQRVYPDHSPAEVRGWFDEALPQTGVPMDDLLQEVQSKVLDGATLNIGTNMYAYVMSGGNQVSIMGDLLCSAINQNVAKWHLAPAMTELEKRVIQWAAEFIGYSAEAGGAMVSGGSAANLTGLTVARNIFFERFDVRRRGLFGLQPFVVYASDQTHSSVDKSIHQLGIGSDHYRKIPVNNRFQIDCDQLEAAIAQDRSAGLTPFCVIGNAGTVNTGAIDPLNQLATICQKYGLWFHVDGAYGALVASLPELATYFDGLQQAHSIACDFHKWLYQPFEVGCTLVRDWSELKRTFHVAADYLANPDREDGRMDITEHHFQLSRNAKALKVWMTFKAFGSERLTAMIRKDIEMRRYLDNQLQVADDFRHIDSGPLAISCFQYLGSGDRSQTALNQLNQRLLMALERDGRVFITGTKLNGQQVIRACIINHRIQRSDIDHLVEVIREVGQKLQSASANL